MATKRRKNTWQLFLPDAPWDWNISLQKLTIHVGKYTIVPFGAYGLKKGPFRPPSWNFQKPTNFSMDPSKIEWDRIPTDPFFGSCDRAIREPQVFSGSVDRGSDRWRFLGMKHMGVSKNSGTPKSSIIIGFSIINHPFWGTLIFGNPHMGLCRPSSFLLPPPFILRVAVPGWPGL